MRIIGAKSDTDASGETARSSRVCFRPKGARHGHVAVENGVLKETSGERNTGDQAV